MKTRDYDFIEARLLAPAPELLEAVARLKELGKQAWANRLLDACADLTDVCRDVRADLRHERWS